MKDSFTNAFADFLEERLGNALYELREKNEEYRKLSDDYVVLLSGKYNTVAEYQQTISRISEIGEKISDIEKRYLFLIGMRECTKIKQALSMDDFEKMFIS